MGKTVAEKIIQSHVVDRPAEDVWVIRLDAVLCHEITTPTAILDLVARGKDRVFDPARIKAVIDHVTPAKDSQTARQGKVLRAWARRHGIKDFFDVGSGGVCHVFFPEKGFIRPGYAVVMGDSHTCTDGAFGAFTPGVGTTDLAVAILKGVCAVRTPRTMKITLTGKLAPGVFAKDVILSVIGRIGVNGATHRVVEFDGPVPAGMDMEGRMTLCNMTVEAGGTCGICYPDAVTADYLWKYIRDDYPSREAAVADFRRWWPDPDAGYEEAIVHDVSGLEPMTTFGFKPDNVKPVREMEGTRIDQVFIGSCTNGRISDLRSAASVLKGRRIHPLVRGILCPATPAIYAQALAEGLLQVFLDAGFCVTNPTCGPCLGMSTGVLAEGEVCASTSNRNFNGRMGRGGMVHLMSPATAAASAVAGCIVNSELYQG
jgi:3-isopropylmalate/(R)-2-methylmalate dehydratase large subunit